MVSSNAFRPLLSLLLAISFSCGLQNNPTRRNFLYQSAAGLCSAGLCLPPDVANAARGAAELDFEYYMRDLVGGNKKEGNVQPTKPPPVKPPRILKEPLLSLLLDDDCTPSCIPVQALLATAKSDVTPPSITEKMNEIRSRSSRSFGTRAQWKADHVSDQYYFDLTCYALFKVASGILPNYADREKFLQKIGDGIYSNGKRNGLFQKTITTDSATLTATVPAMTEILNVFKESNFIESYRIGETNNEKKDGATGFDVYDDEDLQAGASVNCLISLYEPSSLGASLQITGEQSRFAPEFVGRTLASMWDSAGIQTSYETYFVDNEYRSNPKDFFPNEQLLQFELRKKK